MPASREKRELHNASETITVRAAPRLSSFEVNSRPRTGATPSISNRSDVTMPDATEMAGPEPVSVTAAVL